MKLSSRKELLNEAEEVLRQIRNENKQNLNEGFLYNIWSKIIDKIDDQAETLFLLPVAAGKVIAPLIATGQVWIIPILLAVVGAAMGFGALDDLLRKYFQSRYFDKKLKPIVDELIPIFSKDAPINAHMANIRKINNEIEEIEKQYGSIKKYSKGSPEIRKALSKKEQEMKDEIRGLESKIRDRFTLVMRKTGMNKKFMSSMPDKGTFAGDKFGSPERYKADVRDAVLKAIEPTSSELQSIQRDVKQMKESVRKRKNLL
jgi:hypothetical protein